MPEIRVLEKHIAELIAAGEVVERPASVAKELLENAIDAGATQVTLSILRGGIEQLQVQDNGCGISADQIATAFIRHATSKISSQEDLEEIHTLGFRGEALPSIACVAKVEVLSRTDEEEFASRYRIEGGVELGCEVDARPVGTTITVNQLFYNTPARMKFLKKDASEGSFVADIVQHVALSHPEVSFRFIREGKQQFVTPGDGKLMSAAYAVLGREFSHDLLTVDCEMGLYRVEGLITPPRACRASRSAQYFYINGRFVKNRTMMAAMENAYKGTIMQGKFPGGILILTMPPKLVDVNVHPAKTEVRFARDSEVFDVVYRGVKEALNAPGSGDRTFKFKEEKKPEAAAAVPQPEKHFATVTAQEYRQLQKLPQPGKPKAQPDIRPAETARPVISMAGPSSLRSEPIHPYGKPLPVSDERELDILVEEPEEPVEPVAAAPVQTEEPAVSPEPRKAPAEEPAPQPEQISMLPKDEEEPLIYIGEIFRTYIICQRGEEMCLLDKHAAHERLLYEQLAASYGNVPGQTLLEPVQVSLSAEEKQAVLENQQLLLDTGLDVEDFGGNTVVVREVPADVRTDDIENLVIELASRLAKGSKDAVSEKTEWVMHSMACRAAVKGGDKDAPAGLLKLAQDILSGRVPPFCPHGRPVVLRITRRELEKQFGRIV